MFISLLYSLTMLQGLALAQPVSDNNVRASLSAFFATRPTIHGATAELVRMPRLPHIKGHIRWSFPRLHILPRRVSLIAETGQGKQLRRWYINAEVRWMADVVCLKQDIPAQTILDKNMLTVARMEVTGLRGQTWQNITDAVGLKSLRDTRKHQVVVSTAFKRPPLIQRGDSVTILAEASGIKVRAAGIALKSGQRGERLLVQNVRSKQTLQSIVRDAHTVAVYVGGS